LKVIAMGFVLHRKSYLRDIWNWLDLLVVLLGIAGFLPRINSNSNLKALRTFRVLRPLRSMKSVPHLRRLIESLIRSIKPLGSVVLFLGFVFVLIGIFGV